MHLSHDALTSGEPDVPVQVCGAGGWAGGQLLTTGQIAQWCGRDDTTRVSVKPVLDLAAYTAVDAHDPPAAMAEQVRAARPHLRAPLVPAPRRGAATWTT